MKFSRKKKSDPFEIFFQNSSEIALIINEDYRILNGNMKARELLNFGIHNEAVLDLFDIVHEDDLSAVIRGVTECKGGVKKDLLLRMNGKNGILQVNASILFLERIDGGLNGYLIMAEVKRDNVVNDIAQTEKINRLAQRLFNILESISDAFYSLDHDWNFKYINKRAEEVLKRERKKLYGKNIWNEFPELLKGRMHEEFLQTMESRNSSQFEFYMQESSIWFEIYVYPFEGGISVFLQNINSRKQSEKEIRNYIEVLNERNKVIQSHTEELKNLNERLSESEKSLKEMNANKDKLFSIIAHDLRNPFNSIMSYLEFLITEYKEIGPDEALSGLHRLNKNVKLVFALLENLLEWSRIQTNKIKTRPENLNMNEIAAETLYLLKENASNKKIKLYNLIDEKAAAFADKNMVSSVLQNLVSNSIKFTKAEGKIEVSGYYKDDLLIIKVEDNGVGMSRENVAKLFKIEENVSVPGTDNEKGTGLGLILCKELIEKNKGNIWCESKLGEGSEFYFSLPALGN